MAVGRDPAVSSGRAWGSVPPSTRPTSRADPFGGGAVGARFRVPAPSSTSATCDPEEPGRSPSASSGSSALLAVASRRVPPPLSIVPDRRLQPVVADEAGAHGVVPVGSTLRPNTRVLSARCASTAWPSASAAAFASTICSPSSMPERTSIRLPSLSPSLTSFRVACPFATATQKDSARRRMTTAGRGDRQCVLVLLGDDGRVGVEPRPQRSSAFGRSISARSVLVAGSRAQAVRVT